MSSRAAVSLALPLAALALAAAGCGGGSSSPAGTRAAAAPAERCRASAVAARRSLARIDRDIAALRRAADRVPAAATFKGDPAVNRATDRFLLDLGDSPVRNVRKNRLIDHAMAALVGSCEQCFQALEAARPIPAIKFPDGGCGR